MSASEARSVRLVGAAIAALSGLLGAASLLLHWWSTALGCRLPGCPHAVVTGWSGLGTARVLLLLLAPAGLLPLVAELMRPAARRWLALLAALAGLGGALLIVFRVAVGPIESVPAGLAPTGLAASWRRRSCRPGARCWQGPSSPSWLAPEWPAGRC